MADFGIGSVMGGGFSGLGGFGAGFMEHKSPTTVLPKLVEPAQIGDYLECDVILSRTTDFSAEVTEYPVEDGFSISDHCIRKPLKLQLEVLFTPTPVTWWNAAFGGKLHTLNRVINAIMDIWKKGEPVTIKLVDAIYEDMVLTSAPMPRKAEDGYCYRCTLQFTHVRRVTQRTEDIPEAIWKRSPQPTPPSGTAAFTISPPPIPGSRTPTVTWFTTTLPPRTVPFPRIQRPL